MIDYDFYLQVVKYITIVICVFIISVMTSCQVSKYTLVELTERADNDPIAAACSLNMYDSQSVSKNECTLYLTSINRKIAEE